MNEAWHHAPSCPPVFGSQPGGLDVICGRVEPRQELERRFHLDAMPQGFIVRFE